MSQMSVYKFLLAHKGNGKKYSSAFFNKKFKYHQGSINLQNLFYNGDIKREYIKYKNNWIYVYWI